MLELELSSFVDPVVSFNRDLKYSRILEPSLINVSVLNILI